MSETESKILDQIERTNKLINRLENQRYLQMVDRPFYFMFLSFLHGMAVALGSTVGVAAVLWILVTLLQKLEVFAPIANQLNHVLQVLEKIGSK